MVRSQLCALGLGASPRLRPQGRKHGLGEARARQAEVDAARPAVVHDLDEQLVRAGAGRDLQQLLVRGHAALDVAVEDEGAVPPDLDGVVAAEGQLERPGLGHLDRPAQVRRRVLGREGVGLAVHQILAQRPRRRFHPLAEVIGLEGEVTGALLEGPRDRPGLEPRLAPARGGLGRLLGPGLTACQALGILREQLLLHGRPLALEALQLGALLAREDRDRGHGVDASVAVVAAVGDRVEVREELVVLPLGEGVVLVVVAPRTPHGQAEEGLARGGHPVGRVLDQILLLDRPALVGDHVVAVEPRRDARALVRVRQEVPRKLFHHEAVVGQVPVVGVDDPVPPGPHVAPAVDRVAVRVGVARGVEPLQRHALAVVRRGQQTVDHALVGIGPFIGEERTHLLHGRRQAGQVEGHAPEQGRWIGLGRHGEPLRSQCLRDERIDPMQPLGRDLGPTRRHEGPVLLPRSPGLDPGDEQRSLLVRQRLGASRGHLIVRGSRRIEPMRQLTLGGVGSEERAPRARAASIALRAIQPQPRLARRIVRPVAGEALRRQHRPHLASEVGAAPEERGGGQRQEQGHELHSNRGAWERQRRRGRRPIRDGATLSRDLSGRGRGSAPRRGPRQAGGPGGPGRQPRACPGS